MVAPHTLPDFSIAGHVSQAVCSDRPTRCCSELIASWAQRRPVPWAAPPLLPVPRGLQQPCDLWVGVSQLLQNSLHISLCSKSNLEAEVRGAATGVPGQGRGARRGGARVGEGPRSRDRGGPRALLPGPPRGRPRPACRRPGANSAPSRELRGASSRRAPEAARSPRAWGRGVPGSGAGGCPARPPRPGPRAVAGRAGLCDVRRPAASRAG